MKVFEKNKSDRNTNLGQSSKRQMKIFLFRCGINQAVLIEMKLQSRIKISSYLHAVSFSAQIARSSFSFQPSNFE